MLYTRWISTTVARSSIEKLVNNKTKILNEIYTSAKENKTFKLSTFVDHVSRGQNANLENNRESLTSSAGVIKG